TISSAAFVAALSLLGLLRGMPRSVFLLDWVVMIFFSGGIRFAARALRESRLARARLDDGRRTIIIGAGEGGEQLLRQVLHDPRAGMNVVGRSEEHTSELQSRGHLVCRLLLEKKK